ncbi:hypothetical protein PY092_09790 [Muricauda sp. 334s03]|uniref:Uncharacterized protein n=1 Tax=Flagellimonas yonaguniensis TaxID=3031325 RepID=A0ABT5XZ23_9FLAO|nr:hypothetical protein [[Muricauda] yonaguniensis]MDF0716439.1 hypothetical protein [[Muricauda] yonaguniensis]
MITISRPDQQGTGVQKYRIYANDQKVCEIENGEKIQIDLNPGNYEIEAKVFWFGSKILKTDLTNGEELIVRGPKYGIWIAFIPSVIYAILVFLDLDSTIVLYSFLGLCLLIIGILFSPIFRKNYIEIVKKEASL